MPARPTHPALLSILLALALPAPARGAGTPPGGCAGTTVVLNGDFELGIDPGVASLEYPGSTAITDWMVGDTGAVNGVGSSSVDYKGTYWPDHTTGSGRSLDLSGLAPGKIFQTFATVISRVYDVSFWMNGNPYGAPDPKELWVSAGDVSLLSFGSPAALPWVQKTFSFTATAALTTLIFEVPIDAANNTNFGPGIDDVVVVAHAPPVASAAPAGPGCAGGTLRLDGSPSTGCTGAIDYRWLDGVNPVCDWSATPTCDVTPATTTVYTLEVRCASNPNCVGSTTATATILPCACASTQVILNGDFELGTDPGVGRAEFPGSTAISDWLIGDTGAVNGTGSSSVDYIGTLWADHTTGSGRSLDMSGLAPGKIFQSFATVINQVYDVSFWMIGNSGGPPDPKELLVSAGDVSLMRFTSPAVLSPWVEKTFSFTATAALTTLTFEVPNTVANNTVAGPGLDDVSVVTETPPVASAATVGPGCAGSTLRLDGSPSSGCTGAVAYRWLDGAAPVCDWSGTPTCDVTPATTTVYTLEVRCASAPDCVGSTTATATILPYPSAVAGPDVSVCAGTIVTLDGSASTTASCPAGALFAWREGTTVLRPFDPSPSWQPPNGVPGVHTYTLVVACAPLPTCTASDLLTVSLRSCTLGVRYRSFAGTRSPDGTIEVSWITTSEDRTLGFRVERATHPEGPFEAVGAAVAARGSGSAYTLRDQRPAAREPWYRVVELTDDGRGDETPPFTPRADRGRGEGGRQRGSGRSR